MAHTSVERGLDALRRAVAQLLLDDAPRALIPAGGAAWVGPGHAPQPRATWLLMEGSDTADSSRTATARRPGGRGRYGDAEHATSSADDAAERERLIALVELARGGDKDAFGALYDHYHLAVYRFLYYRVSSTTLAEDLTADTFFRALRSMDSFRWQGKDFGAWLMTIARNLATDHFKSGRHRLERPTEDTRVLDSAADGPEEDVLASLTNERLLSALADLPGEQRDCLVMRFLEGLSIAETADALGRTVGAVKQLQLRGVRNLARLLPAEAIR